MEILMINEDFEKDHSNHELALKITFDIMEILKKVTMKDMKDTSKWAKTIFGSTFIVDMALDKKIPYIKLPQTILILVNKKSPTLATVTTLTNGVNFLSLSVIDTSSMTKTVEDVKNISNSRFWAENIYHEVIHLIQRSVYSKDSLKSYPSVDPNKKPNYSKYFNNPLEFDAFFQQMTLDYMRIYSIIKNDPSNYEEYMDRYNLSDDFKFDLKHRFLDTQHGTIQMFLQHINKKRYQRLIKRIFNIHKAILSLKPNDLSESLDYSDPLWHGTYSNGIVKKIAKQGVKGRDIQGKQDLAPIKGKVYMTPKLGYALIYALGGDIAGINHSREIKPGERYGYLLKFDPTEVSNPHPDEDEIGQFFTYAYQYENDKKIYNEEIKAMFDKHPSLVRKMSYVFDAYTRSTKQLRSRSLDGDYGAWAKLGKKIIREYPHNSDLFKQIMNLLKSHVAVDEGIMPLEIWRFDRRNAKHLKRDGSNLFDYAKKVWSR